MSILVSNIDSAQGHPYRAFLTQSTVTLLYPSVSRTNKCFWIVKLHFTAGYTHFDHKRNEHVLEELKAEPVHEETKKIQ